MIDVSDELLAELVKPGAVVAIGEMHGSHEFPQLVGRLVELAVDRGLPVLVGLEVPISEQPAIDAFMASAGTPDDVQALTASTTFWHPPPQLDDGRAGAGALELFTTARAAAVDGPVRVFGFDLPRNTSVFATPEEARILNMPRDRFMAETVTAAIESWTSTAGPAFTVLLAGSIHTRIVRYDGAPEPHLAELLIERFPHLLTLQGHWTSGQIRAMESTRAEILDVGSCRTPPGSLRIHNDPGAVQRSGHHGWVNVGVLTASPPLTDP